MILHISIIVELYRNNGKDHGNYFMAIGYIYIYIYIFVFFGDDLCIEALFGNPDVVFAIEFLQPGNHQIPPECFHSLPWTVESLVVLDPKL